MAETKSILWKDAQTESVQGVTSTPLNMEEIQSLPRRSGRWYYTNMSRKDKDIFQGWVGIVHYQGLRGLMGAKI